MQHRTDNSVTPYIHVILIEASIDTFGRSCGRLYMRKKQKYPKRKAEQSVFHQEIKRHVWYYDLMMRTGQLAFLTQ
jgi:hypothetical protein